MNRPASLSEPWEDQDYPLRFHRRTPNHPDPRVRTINNLKCMALAMHNYAATHGRFPTAAIRAGGEPLLSWRVAILPYLEQDALYRKFRLDEAWNSPHNLSLLGEMPRVYAPVGPEGTGSYATYYQGVVDSGSLFDGQDGARVAEVMSLASPTLMFVEAADPVPWTKPEDVPYRDGGPLPAFGGHSSDGVYVVLADGSVRLINRKVSPETLRALIRRGEAGVIGIEEIGPGQNEWLE
jgi:Protein of unknown function (DUF1559)